jgi:hypothetical protein
VPPQSAIDVRRMAVAVKGSLRDVYHDMARRYHPDHGGSDAAMIAVNDMYDRLDKILTQRLSELK